MLGFFDCTDAASAWEVMWEIGRWIREKVAADVVAGKSQSFIHLFNWWENLASGWGTLKNYFEFPVTSSLAEGVK